MKNPEGMATKEQAASSDASVIRNISDNNNHNNNTTEEEEEAQLQQIRQPQPKQPQQHQQQKHQEQLQEQYAELPKASPPPQVIIIPATQASTVATNAAKKIRRAFTMPRNPFRWSRKFKTSSCNGGTNDDDDDDDDDCSPVSNKSGITSCVGGGRGRTGSIVSLNSYEAISKDSNGGRGGEKVGGTDMTTNDENNHDKMERKIGGKQNRNSSNIKAPTMMTATTTTTANSTEPTATATSTATTTTTSTSTNSTNRILRRSSFRKFLNRIAQHVSNTVNIGANKQTISLQHNNVISTSDRVPPIGGYQWPADQTPGVMGLKNHGNTCFMNAVLQCLSHTDILAEYFVLDQYKADLKRRNKINSRKFGTKGELTEQLANVLKALWTCKNESDHSTSFKAVVDRYGSQFRSSTQHDAQEFLFWLLDKVHEDLNTATKRKYKSVKNSYGRPDEIIAAETLANHIRCNNSFVQAVFQAQFRSSLTCPRCKKQSNTFDPFHCISVQLPQLMQQNVFVTVVYLKQQPRQVKLGLRVPAGSPIVALREQLQSDTGIASERMVLVDINKEGFTRVFYDTQPIETLNGIETIYCIEVPARQTPPKSSSTAENLASMRTEEAIETEATSTALKASASVDKLKSTPPKTATSDSNQTSELLLLVANVRKRKKVKEIKKEDEKEEDNSKDGEGEKKVLAAAEEKEKTTKLENENDLERFGIPFSMRAPRDCSYVELQKKLLREMSVLLKPDVFSYTTPLTDMFQIRLQCPSADPDSYLEQVEHPLLTEMIDMALSVLSAEAGPAHIKLLLEWPNPEEYFTDLSDTIVEHESVALLRDKKEKETQALTLEQCLEHYTKAETLSAEDAWRCPHCQQYLPVVKTLGLWSLPDILVVHFKRFRQHQEKGPNAAKLTTMVKFPLNAFDMSPHLAKGTSENGGNSHLSNLNVDRSSGPWRKAARPGDSRSSTLNSRDNKETRYDLYAVCYHQGDTLETGHYTAACKNPYDHQWYKFDDQRVSKVPNESIQEEIINNEAYMLFYQRRNEGNECSGSSSNSGGDHWVSRLPPPPGATPVPPIEKFTANTEKIIAVKVDDDKIDEEDNSKTAEKAEIQPVDRPKIEEFIKDPGLLDTSKDLPVKEIVIKELEKPAIEKLQKPNLVDIDKIDFADADDGDGEADGDNDIKQVVAAEEPKKIKDAIENPKLLKMPTLESSSLLTISMAKEANHKAGLTNGYIEGEEAKQTKLPLSKSLVSESSDSKLTAATVKLTNGFKTEIHNDPVFSPKTEASKTIPIPKTDSSSSSSESSSSGSSDSSPHALSTSVQAASDLHTKFNGFASSIYASSVNNQKEAFLSSSLKSNSSTIIGANNGPSSHHHEFHLSHYQHQNWNGSRFSVSAVENASANQNQSNSHGLNLRHSFSTSSNYKLRECNDTLSSLLRNSANTCSKDTLLFIDQQNHHHHHHHHHHHNNSLLEDDDDTFMGSRSLWISPVTPHKLITVSPKN